MLLHKFQPLYHQVLSQSLACGHLSGEAIRSHVHLQEYQGNWVFPSNGWRWAPPQSRPFKKKKKSLNVKSLYTGRGVQTLGVDAVIEEWKNSNKFQFLEQ